MSPSTEGRLAPLLELVRGADRDRYLAALYAPEDRRGDLLALYAFNAEISGIRDRVSQALPGEIRLQWWCDVIAAQDAGAGAGHPVAEALLGTIERRKLPREAFQNYLDARIFDLYDDPMPTRGDLEGYCGETAAALLQLSSIVLEPQAAALHAELAGHAGCAQAIAGLLRLLPLHRRRGQCYVPKEILAAAGTSPEEFLAGDGGPNAPRAVVTVRSPARMAPGSAACSSRAATLTASPDTNELPSRDRPTTTSPVLTPMRRSSWSPNTSASRRCMASPACNARSA